MKDFMNFAITSCPLGPDKVRHTLQHSKRGELVVEFTTGLHVSSQHLPGLIERLMAAYERKYSKATLKNLTRKQQAGYDALVKCHRVYGRAPTYDELAEAMGKASRGTAFTCVQKLIAKGWVWLDRDGVPMPLAIAPPDMEF